ELISAPNSTNVIGSLQTTKNAIAPIRPTMLTSMNLDLAGIFVRGYQSVFESRQEASLQILTVVLCLDV
ncbi:hypothetical protein ACXYUI_33545, partial [Klebsiella pneumoniae]